MRTGLRLMATAVAFVSLVFWLFGGPNLGRTRTTVAQWAQNSGADSRGMMVDRRFAPGVDFLAGAWAIGGAMFAASFLAREQK